MGPTRPDDGAFPRRDLILLPVIALVTLLVLLAIAEIAARTFFVVSGRETCNMEDLVHGYRIRPNCTSHRKAAEGPEVEMTYNDCGYRSPEPCHSKPASSLRIALLGSSTAQGFKAPYNVTFAARASTALTRMCGRPVDIQNMGVAGYKPLDSYLRVDEALALKPDVVVWVLVPYDLEQPETRPLPGDRSTSEGLTPRKGGDRPPPVRRLMARLNDMANELINDSRAVLVAQHFLFQDPATFVRLQLALGDKTNYLRLHSTPAWQARYRDLDLMVAGMAEKIHRAGIPFLIVFGTELAQADLAHLSDPPSGTDPAAAGTEIGQIAARRNVLFLDTLDAFRVAQNPSTLFYVADGHMSPAGHAVFAGSLIGRLTRGDIPAFSGCETVAQPEAAAQHAP